MTGEREGGVSNREGRGLGKNPPLETPEESSVTERNSHRARKAIV